MLEPRKFYEDKIQLYLSRVNLFQKWSVWISAARLAAFVMICIGCYFILTDHSSRSWSYLLSALMFGFFIILLRISFNISGRKKLAQKLLFINRNEVNVLANGRNSFPNGEQTLQRSIYSEDLDIIGERSLYHHLNRTTTVHGASRLSSVLTNPFRDLEHINQHQAAVKQICKEPDQMQMITASGLLREGGEGTIAEINEWIASEGKLLQKKWLNVIRFVWPVIMFSALVYYLDTNNPIPFGTGFLISWAITGTFAKYVLHQHRIIGRKQTILEQYAFILKRFDELQGADSKLLQDLKMISATGKHEIKKLSRLTALLDQRLNLLVNFFINSFFLYDIHCMIALEKWKSINRERFRTWIEGVGEMEMLNSLAIYAFNNPSYTYPETNSGNPMIMASELAHPLIPSNEAVPNNFEIGKDAKVLLITGSNMSGKSTFLRTVGINLVLAQCGAPVCASKFEFTPMRILSSIRISDSLQEHTSFFMAELKRLKEIISVVEKDEPALVLIDEVLRGTNSNDKTHGSAALIERLVRYNCLTLFATHDLSLSELENKYPAKVGNYCFESRIEMDELTFDYKLKHGVATNKNATFLMQKMGIIKN